MKKFLFYFASISVIMCSCSKMAGNIPADAEEPASTELVDVTFTASSDLTKVYMDASRNVYFAENDKISVFAEGSTTNYEFTTTSGGDVATFTGSMTPEDAAASTFYALYPYTEGAEISGDVISGVKIGSGTDGTAVGRFNSKKAVSVAVSDTKDLHFKNVCALLKVVVPADVTDLSNVVVFANDSDNKITGTFNVTPHADAAPTVEVTSGSNQIGFAGSSGSSVAAAAGEYYMPVLPVSLTKGLNVKATYLDNSVSRGFNGAAMALVSGSVYNLGTLKKTSEYIYANLENNSVPAEIGEDVPRSVVENTFKTVTNNSEYVLKVDASGNSAAISGPVRIDLSGDSGKIKFPYAVRDKFDTFKVKAYLGDNIYCPRFDFNFSGGSMLQRPYSINGYVVDGSDSSSWSSHVLKDDWNILEWKADQFSKSHFSSLDKFFIRAFLDFDGNNCAIVEGSSNHILYLDDFIFVLK